MPVVLRLNNLRAVIYPNDHRPAHVHVISADCEAVFNLHCPDGPPELRENYGLARREVTQITTWLAEQLRNLCEAWERIHGKA